MHSTVTIRAINRKAAITAAKLDKIPFVVEAEDIDDWKDQGKFDNGFPFPFLGAYVPTGWVRTKSNGKEVEHIVSLGKVNGESIPGLIGKLREGYGYAVTQLTDTLVRVGEYQRVRGDVGQSQEGLDKVVASIS